MIITAADWDATRWPNMDPVKEVACKHCGLIRVEDYFLDEIQTLRDAYGLPIYFSSFYRCPVHNKKVSSTGSTGPHTKGAADLIVNHDRAIKILSIATQLKFTGIGVSQRGPISSRFIHLDMVSRSYGRALWSY